MASVSLAPNQGPCDKGCGVRVRVTGSLGRTYPDTPILVQPQINHKSPNHMSVQNLQPQIRSKIPGPHHLTQSEAKSHPKIPERYKRMQPAISQSFQPAQPATPNTSGNIPLSKATQPISVRKLQPRIPSKSLQVYQCKQPATNLTLKSSNPISTRNLPPQIPPKTFLVQQRKQPRPQLPLKSHSTPPTYATSNPKSHPKTVHHPLPFRLEKGVEISFSS